MSKYYQRGGTLCSDVTLWQIWVCLYLVLHCLHCQNPNLTSTQGWVWHKNDFAHPTTTTTPHHRNSISAISQLLLTRFWWNFKGRFLWTSRTDSNCNGDICPGNICPRDTCPYQEYLSTWFWWNFKDSNSYVDICPGNICSGDICTYQKYFNC